jgi:Transposase DDE domain group 1
MVYCDRGRMENFIKNHKILLHSDRISCHTFAANHLRLLWHSAEYVLLHALAEHGLQGTVWTRAQAIAFSCAC